MCPFHMLFSHHGSEQNQRILLNFEIKKTPIIMSYRKPVSILHDPFMVFLFVRILHDPFMVFLFVRIQI